MLADTESLLAPISEDDPAGPDLDYDSERDTLRLRFHSGFADDTANAPAINWGETIGLIEQQFARSKDLWLPVYLMRAGAMAGRLGTVRTGAETLAGLLERYWDTVHPKLDDLGVAGRITPCSSLARLGEFINPLRRTILISHPRLGKYSGVDVERFDRNGAAEEDYGKFQAALQEVPREDLLAAVADLEAIREALERSDGVFAAQADDDGPNFEATYDALDHLLGSLKRVADIAGDSNESGESGESDEGESPGSRATHPAETSGKVRAGGAIESRDDVLQAIDAVTDYYRRKEPSSPVPVALRRIRGWVSLDFMTILQDIAPASLEEIKRVLVMGTEESET